MKALKEMWSEMDYEEKKEAVEGLIAWSSLFFLAFMVAVIGC